MDRKILKWNFIFQYGWVLTNIVNSILLLPFYLKNIDSHTLGIWLATGSILGWMTIIDPGVGEVLQQKIAELRGQRKSDEIGKLIGSGIIASVFIFFIAVLIGLACYFFIGEIINKDISIYPNLPMALVLSIVATGLSLTSFTLTGINTGFHNSAQVAICSLSANFIFLFTNLLFLLLGLGVLSIAIANLARAVYINIYNIVSLSAVLKKELIHIIYERLHFKRFIRIFSFTSFSKIITGLSNSIDMLVLARFISPAFITIYEINRRPINVTHSLIGRHSVALMPLISHAKGKRDKEAIISLINQHFKIYSYALLFIALLFFFCYEDLITVWTGPGQYAGNLIKNLLVAYFFFGVISYFMSNVGYALGDIKVNSLYNIIRGISYGILMFFAARNFGITGALAASLALTATSDFIFYYYRVYKLGYLQASFLRTIFKPWIFIIPVAGSTGWAIKTLTDSLLPVSLHLPKLLVNGTAFTLVFMALLLFIDSQMRTGAKKMTVKYIIQPLMNAKRA